MRNRTNALLMLLAIAFGIFLLATRYVTARPSVVRGLLFKAALPACSFGSVSARYAALPDSFDLQVRNIFWWTIEIPADESRRHCFSDSDFKDSGSLVAGRRCDRLLRRVVS